MRLTRVHVDAGLHTGSELELPETSAAHLTRVLRLQIGDSCVVFDGREVHELTQERVSGTNLRGTGCSYASALAVFLARGNPLVQAAARAQQHVAGQIRSYTET